MLSFLQQLQIDRHSLDHNESGYDIFKKQTKNVKVLDIKDEKFSNKDIKQ